MQAFAARLGHVVRRVTLCCAAMQVPGWRCEHHSFWLFPVAVEEPRELVAELCRAVRWPCRPCAG